MEFYRIRMQSRYQSSIGYQVNQLVGAFGIIITNPCEIFCSFKYVKIIDYDVVLNAQKSTQVSSGNVAKMVPIYDLSRRTLWIQNPVSFGKCRFEPDPRYNTKTLVLIDGGFSLLYLLNRIKSYPIICPTWVHLTWVQPK